MRSWSFPCRPAVLLAAACILVPLVAEAQDSARARIVLYQLAGQKDDSTLAAVLSTVADSVELSLDVLQRYDVTRLPAADPSTDLAAVKSYCEAHRVDQAILGSGSARSGGGYDFRLVVYDRRKDSITVDQKGSSSGALDMFDTTDALVASLLDGLSGTHLLFGNLSVETDPAGATVAVNGKDVGPSPVSLRGLPVGTVQVSAHAYGREDVKATVTISDGQSSDQSFALARSVGTLTVKAPADAVVVVRSAEIGEKDLAGSGTLTLPTGDYDVTATDAGLPTVPGKLSIARGQTLPWLPWSKAYLAILANGMGGASVAGAKVTVDGQDRGAVPQVVEVDPSVMHRVSITSEHYMTFTADLTAAAADKTVFTADLTAHPGSIKVVTSVPGVQVRLDGGAAQAVTPAVFDAVSAGTHSIGLSSIVNRRLYAPVDPVSVEVQPDQQAVITPVMVPALGRLRITDAPDGSNATLDGSAVPAEVFSTGAMLQAGDVDLEVTTQGGEKWTGTVTLPAGSDQSQSISAMTYHLPRRNLTFDGRAEDWKGLAPVWIASAPVTFPAQPGTSLSRGFVCHDDSYLYVRFEFSNGTPRTTDLAKEITGELDYSAVISISRSGQDLRAKQIRAVTAFRRSQVGGATSLDLFDPITGTHTSLGTNAFRSQVGDGSLQIAIPFRLLRPYLGSDPVEVSLNVLNVDAKGTWVDSIQSDPRSVSFDF